MRRFGRIWLIVITLVVSPAVVVSGEGTATPVTRIGEWSIWRSPNFRICTRNPQLNLEHLPQRCEELKAQLDDFWYGGQKSEAWEPLCDVVVHATLTEYQQALGAEVGSSVGCTTLQYQEGKVLTRRLDIRIDAQNWQVDALPHELTHIVIAQRLGNRRLPPWLDEGLSVLSESDFKRGERIKAFAHADRQRTVYSSAELLRLTVFPRPEYHAAFYAQSGALVKYLLQRGGAEKLVSFADRVAEVGHDQALRETYGIENGGQLDRLVSRADTAVLLAQGQLPQPALVAEARE